MAPKVERNELLRVATAFPAAPATYLLDYDAEAQVSFKTPIVGWAVCEIQHARKSEVDRGDVCPVTQEGVHQDGATILYPDGQVQEINGGLFEDFDEWLRTMKAEYEIHMKAS